MRDDPGPISAPLGSRKKEEGEREALPPPLLLYLDRGRAPLSLIFRVPEGRYVSLLPLPQETNVGRSMGQSVGRSEVGRSVGPACGSDNHSAERFRDPGWDGDPSLL